MTTRHALAWIDHYSALILRVDAEATSDDPDLVERIRCDRQHGSGLLSEPEFFGKLCDTLAGTDALMIADSHQTHLDFRQYVAKHRPALALRVVAWIPVDEPGADGITKIAQQFFARQRGQLATERLL